MNRRLRYLRERIVNALAMLRRGEFLSMVKAVGKELFHRYESVRSWWYRRRQLDYSKSPGSAYVDRRRIPPPAYRPTRATELPPETFPVDLDAIAGELEKIRAEVAVKDRHRT